MKNILYLFNKYLKEQSLKFTSVIIGGAALNVMDVTSRVTRDLDKGWRSKCVVIFKGEALTLLTLDRISLLKTKLFAFCDRDTDYDDCVKLNPTSEELEECYPWVLNAGASELWPKQVDIQFNILKKALAHEN